MNTRSTRSRSSKSSTSTAVALALAACLAVLAGAAPPSARGAEPNADREPPVVDPGPPSAAPSDAVVLFDGKDLAQWKSDRGGAPGWTIENGTMVVNRTGSLVTKDEFGDCQLHLEWMAPPSPAGAGQDRGNSGVYFQGRYEIQILDSFHNKTYPNGQAGAFYGHNPPLVNACRPPGQWQTYDIVFHAPKLKPDGTVLPGSLTVFHNGILIQDHVPVGAEPTTAALFKGVAAKGPLVLQDHGSPVRYRNIWLRPL